MSKEEQNSFLKDLKEYLNKNHPTFTLDISQGIVYEDDKNIYGLDNLAQVYHQVPSDEKKAIIQEHFSKLFEADSFEKEFLSHVDNFDAVKEYISVRLFPLDYLEKVNFKIKAIYRKDLDGTFTVLVFDLPTEAVNIDPKYIKDWKISENALFDLGIKNSLKKYGYEITNEELEDNYKITLLSSNDLFVTNNIFNLTNIKDAVGKYGSLVSIPHRHALLIFPINDKSVLKVVNQLVFITNRMYEEGPGSISPSVFWYDRERFINIPYELDLKKKSFNIYPPDNFTEMLNSLNT